MNAILLTYQVNPKFEYSFKEKSEKLSKAEYKHYEGRNLTELHQVPVIYTPSYESANQSINDGFSKLVALVVKNPYRSDNTENKNDLFNLKLYSQHKDEYIAVDMDYFDNPENIPAEKIASDKLDKIILSSDAPNKISKQA